ncbi:MAG: 2-C-methyl-D-erythritol 4-phosphate cytidylyltransferase [Patulibacter sp.]|nr:2-C-methyl-D-erythritol 4-phosphate cytidylyltransferase [Patulibacter sp.]
MAVALVVGAGRGERLGHDRPKALVPVLGRPLLSWALGTLIAVPALRRIVVVLPDGERLPDDPRDWGLPAGAWDAGDGTPRVTAAPGGRERSHSVRAGLAACGAGPADEPVLVHDGARPLVTLALVDACLAAVADGADAAVAAAAMTDTVKQTRDPRDPDALPRVERTLDRSRLWAVQTPQVFRRSVLVDALAQPDAVLAAATDDASLVEAAGGDVRIVPAPSTNLKVTVPVDLELAELLLPRLRQNDVPC